MIQTKIAKILSPTQVILAAGAEQGVAEGMEFVIYELGELVHDPETGESLGKLELHKARVRISQVQDRYSVATTRTRQVPPAISLLVGSAETVYDKLPLDEITATTLVKRNLTVKVGDLVRSLS